LPPPPPPSIPRAPVKVSTGVMSGLLVHQVQPTYPEIAKMARVEGTVVLLATISRDGTIENLRVVSGHPMLVRSAMDAVRQWRYRPYMLNQEPVEVETQVTVNFRLAH
jgi:protein TonB